MSASHTLRRTAAALAVSLILTQGVMAVSVGELISKCGDDGDAYCKGVAYGAPMQACLDKNYKKLSKQCQAVMDRIRGGEKVSLF